MGFKGVPSLEILMEVAPCLGECQCKQEEKILNEPAAIYWFNEILLVILSGL